MEREAQKQMMTPQDTPPASASAFVGDTPQVATTERAPGAIAGVAVGATFAGGAATQRAADARRTGAASWRPVVIQASLIWLMTRVAYLMYTYYAVVTRHESQVNRGRIANMTLPSGLFVTSWGNGDAAWYVNIARQGYWTPQAAPYFPLYPLLIRLVSYLVGSRLFVAGMIVANLGALGAFIALGLLVAWEGQRAAASTEATSSAVSRTLLAFAAYPLAFLLVAAYSDGVALAFIFAALLCARRGAWRWSALWAALAGLTTPIALILVLPLAWEYGRPRGWFRRIRWLDALTTSAAMNAPRAQAFAPTTDGAEPTPQHADVAMGAGASAPVGASIRMGALAVVAAPIAVALYLLFTLVRFGAPLAVFASAGGAGASGFLAPAGSYAQASALADLGLFLVFAVVAISSLRRTPVTFSLFVVGLLLACLTTGALTGSDPAFNAARYLLYAAPVFLTLGRWMERRPWFDLLVVGGGFALQAIFAIVFLWGAWVA